MSNNVSDKRLLVVLAHPDDESFGMGGTLAHYAELGVAVHLVCATRGEAGTVDEEFLAGYKSIAQLRETELRCAAKALGLASLSFLDYRDSGMAGSPDNHHGQAFVNAPLHEVAEKVVRHIRRIRPQVVLTFDPVGGYHHPDHIAIHKATLRAFEAAPDEGSFPGAGKAFAPEMLYYNAISRRSLRRTVLLMRITGKDPSKVGRNRDIDLTMLARDPDTPPHVSISYKTVEARKRAADACHASQLSGGWGRISFLELYYHLVGRSERFTRAYPPTTGDYRSNDLFAS